MSGELGRGIFFIFCFFPPKNREPVHRLVPGGPSGLMGTKRSHGTKNTLLEGKQGSQPLKRKDKRSQFFFLRHCVVIHPERCFCPMVPFHAKGPLQTFGLTEGVINR